MSLFIKKFNKFISKKTPFKGDRKEKPRSKKVCYNCDNSGHFIANCPYERKEKDNEKNKQFDKSYKKDKKFTKKKPYRQTHVVQEWKSSDESFESESDNLATIAIKDKASSNKSLFPNLSKHTCLMAKESKNKVKTMFLPLPSTLLLMKILSLVMIMFLVMMMILFLVNF
jgi:hypothetical protein